MQKFLSMLVIFSILTVSFVIVGCNQTVTTTTTTTVASATTTTTVASATTTTTVASATTTTTVASATTTTTVASATTTSTTTTTTISYTITYSLDGGTNNAANPATYTIETATITLSAPTKTGYSFDGWYDNASFTGTAITTIAVGSTGDKTYYAKWYQPLQIKQDSTLLLNSTGSYDYGLQLNGVGKAITFTIYNNSSSSITLSGSPKVVISGTDAADFVVTTLPLSTVSANSSNMTFAITFTPSSLGAKSATVTIANSSIINPYTFSLTGTGAEQVATPTFTPNGGTNLTAAQSVTIASTTSGASIRYTTDGSVPTATTGTVYSAAISVDKTTIVKAIAYKTGMADSAVGSVTFVFPITFAMVSVSTTGVSFNFNNVKQVELTPFKMANIETTYKLWYEVKTWATANGYTFANAGREGNDGTIGAAPTTGNYEPVTTVNWRDCIVWCNAYSQKEGLTPIYYTDSSFTTVLKTSTNSSTINTTAGSEDNPYVNWSANGYRLPTEAEWEYAARYKDGTNWTPTSYASGATADYNDATATGEVAWYSTNSGSATHDVGGKRANALGLYDMSGNVFEWNWDWYGGTLTATPEADPKGAGSGSYRIVRGGYWYFYSDYLQVGSRSYADPNDAYFSIGFRVARTN